MSLGYEPASEPPHIHANVTLVEPCDRWVMLKMSTVLKIGTLN